MSKVALANTAYILIGCTYTYWRMFIYENGSIIKEMAGQAIDVDVKKPVFIAGVVVGVCFLIVSWPISVALMVANGIKKN